MRFNLISRSNDFGTLFYPVYTLRWWSKDNFENFKFREIIVQLHNCDIFAICETFLRGNDTLFIENYTWVGNNRLNISPNARRGSGGVGAFINNDSLTKYTYDADKRLEDTLILKLTNRIDYSVIVLFICYLPPDCSTRAVDADAFLNELMKKVYEYQSEGEIILFGDINARMGSEPDYIEGVDIVKPREVIDTSTNSYCDILADFLIDCNLCMLNGRLGKNDFPHISTRGKSVVDYVFIPHEQVTISANFRCDQCRMSVTTSIYMVINHPVILSFY